MTKKILLGLFAVLFIACVAVYTSLLLATPMLLLPGILWTTGAFILIGLGAWFLSKTGVS